MGDVSRGRWSAVRLVASILWVVAAASAPIAAAEEDSDPLGAMDWVVGPGEGRLGDVAQIHVPQGYRFTGPEGAKAFMELTENPVSGQEMGILIPNELDKDSWFLCFEFDPVGYVKDDEKNSLDPDAILKSMTEGTERSNKLRKQRGWPEVHVKGWQTPPFYNSQTNNLEWATRVASDTGESINYSTRLLGRGGVMSADLVVDPDKLDSTVGFYRTLLSGYSFTPGHRYEEFRAGDAIAKYGLTALIAGGAGAVALKTGLLAKFWKVIVIGVLAAAGMFRKAIARLFGRQKEEYPV